MAGLLGLMVANYWRYDTLFGRKWRFLAKLYYDKTAQFTCNTSDDCSLQDKFLDAHIALELVHTSLWNEISFHDYFRSVIHDATTLVKEKGNNNEQHLVISISSKFHSQEHILEKEILELLKLYIKYSKTTGGTMPGAERKAA